MLFMAILVVFISSFITGLFSEINRGLIDKLKLDFQAAVKRAFQKSCQQRQAD